MQSSTPITDPQPGYGTPCAIIPTLSLIGHMPRPGEDVELLVTCALEAEADRYDREPQPFILPKQMDDSGRWTYTGWVELYRFSPSEEKSYIEEMNERDSVYREPVLADDLSDLVLEEFQPVGDAIISSSTHHTERKEYTI